MGTLFRKIVPKRPQSLSRINRDLFEALSWDLPQEPPRRSTEEDLLGGFCHTMKPYLTGTGSQVRPGQDRWQRRWAQYVVSLLTASTELDKLNYTYVRGFTFWGGL
jgi:hypothetical protein